MDLPIAASLCWLVPGIFVICALLNGERGKPYRKPLYSLLTIFVICSGFALWGTNQDMKNEALLHAVERGNMAEVEECLKNGANPRYTPIDTEPDLIQIARDTEHEAIARRLEKAAKE